ncbi:MAG TPA: hypothetical protein VFP12_03585 [Allosphingosinicella sp.]|nr:hypothetical protein [Allosphingosinicella sp.]
MKTLAFLVQLPFSWRQHKVRARRNDMTRERFVAALATNDAEELAAGILWDKLAEVAVIPDFRPDPDDDFLYLYGLADEDLDEDIILEILTSLGLKPPSPFELQRVGRISSPRDFVKLVKLAS